MSETLPPPGAIQNASEPAAPGRSIRAGLSSVIVLFGAEAAETSTIKPTAPAPTAALSGRADLSAAETVTTRGAAASCTAAVVPAANVTTASGAPAGLSTDTAKSPFAGNVPLTADRSIDGDGPATLRTTESAVTWTGAVPLARTDGDAGSIRSVAGAAALGFSAASSNAPPRMVTVPSAPPASAGSDSETRRARPVPSTEATPTACRSGPAATERSPAATPSTGSSNSSESEDAPRAAARTARGACPSDAGTGPAPPNR